MLLGELGYRLTLVVLAGMVALVAVLALGVAGRPEGQSEGPKQSLRAALREAAGHRGYWLLNAGFFFCWFQLVFIATPFPAYLTVHGLGLPFAAHTLALTGYIGSASRRERV